MGEFIRKLQRLLPLFCIAVTSGLILPSQAWAAQSAFDSLVITLAFIVLILVILLVVFIPTIVAFRREHPNRWLIFVVNLAFGGTVVGWVAALVWALHYAHISEDGSNGGESGINLFANDPVTMRIEPALNNANVPFDPVLQAAVQTRTTEDDAVSTLQRLKALADNGAISAEEYAALKAPVLQRLVSKHA